MRIRTVFFGLVACMLAAGLVSGCAAGVGVSTAPSPTPTPSASSTSPRSSAVKSVSPSVSAPSSVSLPTFTPVVAAALRGLAGQTAVPLQGPAGSVGCTGGTNHSPSSGCWTAAWYQADTTSYWVHVGLCPNEAFRALPLHAVGSASCDQSMAALISGYDFEGQQFLSRAQARAAVIPSPPPGQLTPLSLGDGIEGMASPAGIVAWTEGDWHLTVNFSACPGTANPFQLAVEQAHSLVAYLHTHLLPETYGDLLSGGSCGDTSSGSTVLSWAWGRNVYSVSAVGYQPLEAVRLAMAMAPAD
jgi:hypothetical protein